MSAFTGTGRLLRLQLRLDRIKLPLWISLTLGLMYISLEQLKVAYTSIEQITLYASTTAPSVVTRLLGGAITGPSMGEITIVETFLLIALMVCLTNIFLVVRHTRKNEELGRSEIIGSLVVGRQAMLTSTLLLAAGVNVIFALGIVGTYAANDLPMGGAWLLGAGIGLLGMFFAGVAAVTSQLFENSRSANGVAAVVFALSFLLRGLGDALGTLKASGLGVDSNFLSYLSPLGWVTNTRPFSDSEQTWLLGLLFAGIVASLAGAYVLLARRDIGGSTFQSRPGSAHASRVLLARLGLVWRLNRVAFISWFSAMVIMGITIGAVADEFKNLISSNDEMKRILEAYGGGSPIDIMFTATFAISGIALAGYGLQILSRLQAEETSGRLELLLSTPLSRFGWIIEYVVFAAVSAMLILLSTGVAAGITYGLITGDVWGETSRLGAAILVHAPAILVLLGFAIALFGLLPKLFTPLVWASLGGCLLIYQLGVILKLPDWVVNISPFTHTPDGLAKTLDFAPIWIMTAIALGLLTIGLMLYRRRDLTTE